MEGWVGGSNWNKAETVWYKWNETDRVREREITQVQVDDVCIVLAVQVCPAEVSHLSVLTQPAVWAATAEKARDMNHYTANIKL